MTLVPNLLQRLNGNKLLLVALVLLLSLSACDALKKVPRDDSTAKNEDKELEEIQGQKKYNPKTGKYEHTTEVTQEVDTVRWTVSTPEEYPPITSGTSGNPGTNDPVVVAPGGEKLFSYNVAVLMPFLTNRFDPFNNRISDKSDLALSFYSGVKMAFDELSNEGVRLNVKVLDTKASEDEVRNILSSGKLQDAHMIIGPVTKANLKLVAEYARQNFKTIISPLSPNTTITTNNPFYLQASPSLKSHCDAITRHVKERYTTDQVMLVCRNKKAEIDRLKYFQDANHLFDGSDTSPRFEELIITDQTADFNEMDVTPYIKGGDTTTVFVVPSWSNESFIYSFLRKISIAQGDNKVIVYGMPQWMKFKRISYDYYEQLNVHISSSSYINEEDQAVVQFRQNFFNRYGAAPEVDAYVGYDLMRYMGRMIVKHGTKFQEAIDREQAQYLHTRYAFEPIAQEGTIAEQPVIERYENRYVNILEFKDYFFQLAD
ncbi:MAG: ABC transporter substrate-binding protein [Bacteroidota bacterium]